MTGINLSTVPRAGGAYCMYDLDETPVYVGYASDSAGLRYKLRSHFTQQKSSVVTHGRIDILDIWYVEIWQTNEPETAAKQLIAVLDPVFNNQDSIAKDHVIDIESSDSTLIIYDDSTREIRAQPQNRIRLKLNHIQRMINSEQIALRGLTRGKEQRCESVQKAAEYHLSILESEMENYFRPHNFD